MKQHEHDEHEGTEHENSIEEAGGAAVGFTGSITGFNADAQARMADALLKIGKWVGGESGVLLGHIKCAIYREDGSGLTLNLIDMDNGVEIHGTLEPSEKVSFTLMCAVLDVDPAELDHTMHHVLEDACLDIELGHHDCRCHDHEHEHHEHDHGHEDRHHDDDDDESCEHRGGCCNDRNHRH
ncbi:MAG: hydrogenase nickel incorporation protein HypA [Candidatus Methanomethylophilaceae archaeon]